MTDLYYPLAYAGNTVKLSQTDNERVGSSVRHLLDTIAGERQLYPLFGVPLDILFDSYLPDLTVERIRLAMGQLTGTPTSVTLIEAQESKIKIRIVVGVEAIEVEI